MSAVLELWLPILLSAVGVFIVSSVLHMMLPLHKSDHGKLPDEDELLASMRGKGVKQGSYMFPYCNDMKELGGEEMTKKYAEGPVGFMTILPNGNPFIGKSLAQWFVYCLSVSVFVAYVLSFTTPDAADYMAVFRLAGTVAFLGYGWGAMLDSIWKGQPWSTSMKFMFDGLLYCLTTAGIFGAMWS